MSKLMKTSAVYTVIGLILGVYYREFTSLSDFEGQTMLSVAHTHTLMLGMFMFLVVLLLEKNFKMSQFKEFNRFYNVYNLGLVITLGTIVFHGTMDVLGKQTGAAVAGIAGLGHIILTVGLAFLFHALAKAVRLAENE